MPYLFGIDNGNLYNTQSQFPICTSGYSDGIMATPAEGVTSKRPRLCLARIRCVQECIKCLKNTTPFPEPICYVPLEVRCRIPNDSSNGNGNVNDNAGDGNDTHLTATLTIYTEPGKPNERKQAGQLTVAANQIVYVSGEELYTADGKWARLLRVCCQPVVSSPNLVRLSLSLSESDSLGLGNFHVMTHDHE